MFLSLVKKTGDALYNDKEGKVDAEDDNEAGPSEDAEDPKKRKSDSTDKDEKVQLPKEKKVKVQGESKAL